MTIASGGAVRLPPLWLLIAATAVGPSSLHMIVPSLPGIAVDFQAAYGSAQLALTAFLAAMAPAQLVYGPLSDRFGRRPLLLFGLVAYVAGCLACTFAPSLGALVAGRVLQAFGGCAGMVLTRAIVRDVHDRERSAGMIAYITMAMSLAPMISPAVGGWLEVWAGWRWGFALMSAVGAVVLACTWCLLGETNNRRVPIDPRAMVGHYSLLLRSRAFIGYAMGTSCATASWYTFIAGAPFLLVEAMGYPASAYGLWVLTVMGGYTVGNMLAARLSQRLGVEKMTLMSAAAAVTGAGCMVAWTMALPLSPFALFLPMMLTTFGHGLGQPNGIAGAISVHPHIAGSASGLLGFIQMTVSATTTLLLGAIQAPTPLPTVGVLAGAVAISATGFLIAATAARPAT